MKIRMVFCIFLMILLVSTFRIAIIYCNGAVRSNQMQSNFSKESNFEPYDSEIGAVQAPHGTHTMSQKKQIFTSFNVSEGIGVIAKSVQNEVKGFGLDLDVGRGSEQTKSMRDARGQNFRVSNKIDIDNVKQIQRRLLRMLEILDKLSRDHGFTYWVCKGTLLGTMRHSGFIPYDADIDVCMNMKDYSQLKSLDSKKLPGDIWLQDAESDKFYKGSKAVYAKMRDLNTDYVEWSKQHKDWHNGIQVDIFVHEYPDDILSGKTAAGLVFPVKRMPFENITVNIPAQAETLLKKQYHNWMQLPAVGERIHHQGRVEFSAPTWVKMKYPELYPSGKR